MKLKLFTENGEVQPADLVLEFRVFLVSAQTGKHTQECRTLRFWFRQSPIQNGHTNHPNHSNGGEEASVAQDFFRELVSPQEFPRGKKKKPENHLFKKKTKKKRIPKLNLSQITSDS